MTIFFLFLSLLLAAIPAYANADLPLYSEGFFGMTVLVALPFIIAAEAAALHFLIKSERREDCKSAWRVSARANIFSAFIGFFLMPFLTVPFTALLKQTGYASAPIILMHSMFAAGYFISIFLEAFSYNKAWGSGRKWPEKRFFYWSLIVNSLSYGVMCVFFAIGWLRYENTSPFLWYILIRMHR